MSNCRVMLNNYSAFARHYSTPYISCANSSSLLSIAANLSRAAFLSIVDDIHDARIDTRPQLHYMLLLAGEFCCCIESFVQSTPGQRGDTFSCLVSFSPLPASNARGFFFFRALLGHPAQRPLFPERSHASGFLRLFSVLRLLRARVETEWSAEIFGRLSLRNIWLCTLLPASLLFFSCLCLLAQKLLGNWFLQDARHILHISLQ